MTFHQTEVCRLQLNVTFNIETSQVFAESWSNYKGMASASLRERGWCWSVWKRWSSALQFHMLQGFGFVALTTLWSSEKKSNICYRSDEQGLFAKANSVLNISLVRFVSIGKLRYRRDSLMICLRGLILVLTGLILAFCDDSAWVFSNLKDTWLILPAVICSDKRLSHACLRTYLWLTNLRTAHYNSYNLLEIEFLNGYLR